MVKDNIDFMSTSIENLIFDETRARVASIDGHGHSSVISLDDSTTTDTAKAIFDETRARVASTDGHGHLSVLSLDGSTTTDTGKAIEMRNSGFTSFNGPDNSDVCEMHVAEDGYNRSKSFLLMDKDDDFNFASTEDVGIRSFNNEITEIGPCADGTGSSIAQKDLEKLNNNEIHHLSCMGDDHQLASTTNEICQHLKVSLSGNAATRMSSFAPCESTCFELGVALSENVICDESTLDNSQGVKFVVKDTIIESLSPVSHELSDLRSCAVIDDPAPWDEESQEDINSTLLDEMIEVSSYGQDKVECLSHITDPLLEGESGHKSKPTSVSHSDYDVIIMEVLKLAKNLPRNETLQEHLQPFSGHIDHLCGNAILYNLQKERLIFPALSFFDWMRVHTPCLLTSRSLCTMFTILRDANMLDKVLVLFNNLKHNKEIWQIQVFNSLLSALSKHCRYDEALLVFQDMSSRNIHPDSVTFSIMLNMAYKSGSRVNELWQIFTVMEQQKVFAGHEVFGALFKAFCQEGLIDEALKLLSVMEGRGLIPNIVIYNTLIGAFAKSGMLDEAEGLISEMEGKGIRMSIITYNILINAYANSKEFAVAEGILRKMLEKGPTPDVHSYTALIAAYGRNLLSEKAASVFLRMRKNGVSPNVVAYTALIHAYAEDGWYMKAEHAFENMIREGFVPTVETFTSLLHAFRQAGKLEKVKDIWKRMQSEGVMGTRATFNVLMDACAKQGEYAEARNVMNEFNRIGYKPDRKTFNILINAYTRGGQHSKAPDLLKEMRKAGFSPDSYTFTSLIFAFLRVRDFTQAFKYYEEMCIKNQLPDEFTYKKLRTLLDEKFELKAIRNMKTAVGVQRVKYIFEEKRPKSFRKKRSLHNSSRLSGSDRRLS
ncbi:hypothetical protein KP509_03G001000 [Ceratopteris richardii]|nr:hypothetical protein KP509_03G001000 [Ceratopteris richardii]KAH7440593.1 hypothetical protein KP509_03G001000 [Ceratopteris richardii]